LIVSAEYELEKLGLEGSPKNGLRVVQVMESLNIGTFWHDDGILEIRRGAEYREIITCRVRSI